MGYTIYKARKDQAERLVHFLSKRDKADLIFEHVSLDNGHFEGYTIKGEPFFGELYVGENYYFGLFDKKGLFYGVKKVKGQPLRYGDGQDGVVTVYEEPNNNDGAPQMGTYQMKRGLLGEAIEKGSFVYPPLFSAFFLEGEEGYLKRLLPAKIECARFLKKKDDCFFGVANKKDPSGYGVYINPERHLCVLGDISGFGNDSFTLANDSPAIGYFSSGLQIFYKNIALSLGPGSWSQTIKVSKRPIPFVGGDSYSLRLNTFPSLTIKKDRAKDLLSSIEKYEDYGELESSKSSEERYALFACEDLALPVQFGLSFVDRLNRGDISLLKRIFDRFDCSILATPRSDLEKALIEGKFDEEQFIKRVKEVERQRIKEQKELEQKEKEERKRKREEERAKHPQKKRLTKEEREELERQRDLEWSRRNYEFNMRYAEKRAREAKNVSYDLGQFKSNLGIVGYGGFLQRTSVFDFIHRACPMIANGLDYNHTSICVDIDESRKTVTATIDISCNKPVAGDYARDLQTSFMNEMEKAGLKRYLPGYNANVVVKYKTLVKRKY